jgi:hypothetical protein
MAHFAELDDDIVLRVIVVANELLLDANGVEQESIGITFCQLLFSGRWVQTSYNGNIRKNFAGIGYTYDRERNAFIAPQPDGDGWILDENTCRWVNPELEAAYAKTRIEVTRV